MKQQKTYNLFTEPISEREFDKYLDAILERTKQVLKVKASEYVRNNDKLHNFNKAAEASNFTRERALGFMRLKHQISINDILDDLDKGLLPEESVVSEKFGDRLNYDILEEISLLHRINFDNTEASER